MPTINKISTLQYLGSKSRMIESICLPIIQDPSIHQVVDLFAGTGSVGYALAPYKAIISNDLEYYRLVKRPVDRNTGAETADQLNEALGVSKAHVAAMTAGAIFGWHHPDADPRCYNKDGSKKASA